MIHAARCFWSTQVPEHPHTPFHFHKASAPESARAERKRSSDHTARPLICTRALTAEEFPSDIYRRSSANWRNPLHTSRSDCAAPVPLAALLRVRLQRQRFPPRWLPDCGPTDAAAHRLRQIPASRLCDFAKRRAIPDFAAIHLARLSPVSAPPSPPLAQLQRPLHPPLRISIPRRPS